MNTQQPEFNEPKFEEMVLYVASLLARDPSNGSIKLNKVLALSDFAHYERHGRSITGATYIREPFGPAPQGFVEIQQRLLDREDAVLSVIGFTRTQKLLFPRREANLTAFSGEEIAVIQSVLDLLNGKTAMESSEIAHDLLVGWQAAPDKAEIPYDAVHLYVGAVPDAAARRADRLLEEHGDRVARSAA